MIEIISIVLDSLIRTRLDTLAEEVAAEFVLIFMATIIEVEDILLLMIEALTKP